MFWACMYVQSFYVNSRACVRVGNNISLSRTTSGMCDVTMVVHFLYIWCGKSKNMR